MRVEPHGIDSILHVTKRGARGLDIVRDEHDRHRFGKLLFYLNDTFSDTNWIDALKYRRPLERPEHWPEREPLVRILAWTLLSNHFHLLLQEIQEGGIARFMQKLGISMSMIFNLKYKEKGSIFQSGYHGKVVYADSHLNYLAFYILVKNVLEMYPKGLAAALTDFDDAWEWASRYTFSSLQEHVSGIHAPIVDTSD